MILPSLALLIVAALAAALTTYLAFAQTALFSSILVEEGESTSGGSYASAALVNRLRERPVPSTCS